MYGTREGSRLPKKRQPEYKLIVDTQPPNTVPDLHLVGGIEHGGKIYAPSPSSNVYLDCAFPSDRVPATPSPTPDATSGVNPQHFKIYFGSGASTPTPTPIEVSGVSLSNYPLPASLTNGDYQVAVRYYDLAQNIDESTPFDYYTFWIDYMAPNIPTGISVETTGAAPTALPMNEGIYLSAVSEVTIHWDEVTETEAWQSGVYGYIIKKLVGTIWQTLETIQSDSVTVQLSVGPNEFKIMSVDNLGNSHAIDESPTIHIDYNGKLAPVTFPAPTELINEENGDKYLNWNEPVGLVNEVIWIDHYEVTIKYEGQVWKNSTIDGTADNLRLSILSLPTKRTYDAFIKAVDNIGRDSVNQISFSLGNTPVKIGPDPDDDYDIVGPTSGEFNTRDDVLPLIGLTGSTPRTDSEGDLVYLKVKYRQVGDEKFKVYPETGYTDEPIALEDLNKGTFEWYMIIAEFYNPDSGIPNLFKEEHRLPDTQSPPYTFTVLNNILIDGRYVAKKETTPGAAVHFEAENTVDFSGTGLTYEWKKDDVIFSTAANPTFYFDHRNVGDQHTEYSIKLSVTNGNNEVFGPGEILVTVENTKEGTLYANEYWDGDNTVSGTITVPGEFTLEIWNGTTVNITGPEETSLEIFGHLTVSGTEQQPVSIHPETNGFTEWKGIDVLGTADIGYCIIKNAERGLTIVGNESPPSLIHNSTFRDNFIGMHIFNAAPEISDCNFIDNYLYGIKEDAISGDRPNVTGCYFKNNGYLYYHSDEKNISIERLNELKPSDEPDNVKGGQQ